MPTAFVPPELHKIHFEVVKKDKKAVKLLSKFQNLTGLDTYHIGVTLYFMSTP